MRSRRAKVGSERCGTLSLHFRSARVLLCAPMPRAPKPRPSTWVATDDDRRGPQGRKRAGPGGVAVRQLPRVTVRAPGRALATWEAICAVMELPAHDAFVAVMRVYVAGLDAATAGKVLRRARTIRRERFGDAP